MSISEQGKVVCGVMLLMIIIDMQFTIYSSKE